MKCPRCGVELEQGQSAFNRPIFYESGVREIVDDAKVCVIHTPDRCADLSAERARRAEAVEDAARGALFLAMERHDREMRELVTATGIPWEGKSHGECVALVAAELAAHRATAAKLATAREALLFYANVSNWTQSPTTGAEVDDDYGQRARAALAALDAEPGKEKR